MRKFSVENINWLKTFLSDLDHGRTVENQTELFGAVWFESCEL
jgi:hypothetical protein